jgi:hypothetical protein
MQGTRQIGVILYAKRRFFGDGAGGRSSGEDTLAVEHDATPLDWAMRSSGERSIPFGPGRSDGVPRNFPNSRVTRGHLD